MSTDKKSQITLEFLLLIAFLSVMSFGFIYAAGVQLKSFSDNRRTDVVNDFGKMVKRELDLASIVQDGYQREFTLPKQIENKMDYTITLSSTTVIIRAEPDAYSAIVPAAVGSLQKGTNTIKKINNTIFIN